MKLASDSFHDGAPIPIQYTCEGKNISPELHWKSFPKNTRSFALIVDDPDAPSGTWTHWVLYNIPATTQRLPENAEVPPSAIVGLTTDRKKKYEGPYPPPGKPHRYFFKIFAVDTLLPADEQMTREKLQKKLAEHTLDQAQIIGLYTRSS